MRAAGELLPPSWHQLQWLHCEAILGAPKDAPKNSEADRGKEHVCRQGGGGHALGYSFCHQAL